MEQCLGNRKWRVVVQCLALIAWALPVLSQGLPADYERADNFSRRIQGAYAEKSVNAQWLPSNDSFCMSRSFQVGNFHLNISFDKA